MTMTLREYREKMGFGLREVSRATGISPASLTHYERGRSLPSAKNTLVLAEFYGLAPDRLLSLCEAVHEPTGKAVG